MITIIKQAWPWWAFGFATMCALDRWSGWNGGKSIDWLVNALVAALWVLLTHQRRAGKE